MRKIFPAAAFVVALLFVLTSEVLALTWLKIDDFNTMKKVNSLMGTTGNWNINPLDNKQYCISSFDSANKLGKDGYSLRIDYDVLTPQTYNKDFPNTASNGYFSGLNGANLSKFKYLVMYIKGDEQLGYTKRLVVELKDRNATSKYILEGINGSWARFSIPLWEFKGIKDWTNMQELVITFDENVTKKNGSIYVDDIYFATQSEPINAKAVELAKGEKITIDGNLDDWQSADLMNFDLGRTLESGSVTSPEDLSVQSAFLWDKDYLYLAVTVYDDQIFCRETGADIWKEDCIELFLDPKNKGFTWGDPECFQIGFAPTGPDDKPQTWAWFQNMDPKNYVKVASKIGTINGKDSYQIEAAIKWEFLKVNPEKNKFISMSLAVHDLDYNDNSSAKLNWCYLPEETHVMIAKLFLK
jgi:hypothetical protein